MRHLLYRLILRIPQIKGKARLESWVRRNLYNQKANIVYRGLAMVLDPLEWTQIALLRDGIIEPRTIRLYDQILEPGDVYVDVGAHVGFHSLVARQLVGPEGLVIAVEPQPYNCDRILTNWQINSFSNIVLYPAAAGMETGDVILHNQCIADKSRLTLCLNPVNDLPQTFCVPVLKLESLLRDQETSRIKLLKIDAEGYEPEVLKGLEGRINSIDNIVIEILSSSVEAQQRATKTMEIIRSAGFEFRSVDGQPLLLNTKLPENNLWATKSKAQFY